MAIKESPSACIAADESQVAKVVLMPGDPLRAKYVAEHPDLTQEQCAKNLGISITILTRWLKQ